MKESMMSTQNVLVTSDHKKGRAAVSVFRAAYDEAQLISLDAQRLNEAKGWKEYLVAGIKKFSSGKHPVAEELERYFKEVFEYSADLTCLPFPEKEGMSAYMVGGLPLTAAFIRDRVTSHFKVGQYSWKTLREGAMIRDLSQKRPQGMYVFAHVGGDEPDTKHRNKSFDYFTSEKLQCMDPSEYLLSSGFHMWKHGKWMDTKGLTRTSSLWSGGRLVRGGWLPSNGELYLGHGARGDRGSDSGPRELFLG